MIYPSIRIEGQIFSGELLAKLEQSDTTGLRPADFNHVTFEENFLYKDNIAIQMKGENDA